MFSGIIGVVSSIIGLISFLKTENDMVIIVCAVVVLVCSHLLPYFIGVKIQLISITLLIAASIGFVVVGGLTGVCVGICAEEAVMGALGLLGMLFKR